MRYIRYIVICIAVLICSQQAVRSQREIDLYRFKERKKEALIELEKFPRPDTNRINALIKVFTSASFLKERQEVLPYRIEAMALSQKLNYAKGLAYCHLSAGNYLKSSLRYPEALRQFDSVVYIASTEKGPDFSEIKRMVHERIGSIYKEQGNYYAALDHYFESLKYAEASDLLNRATTLYIFITGIYLDLNNLEKASEFAQRNIALVRNDTDKSRQAGIFFPYIDICIAKGEYDTASFYLDKIGINVPFRDEIQIDFGYYLKQGELNYAQQNYSKAYMYFQQAFKYAMRGGHKKSRSAALRFLSNTALKLGDPETAKEYALQNLALSEDIEVRSDKIEALISLSNYYKIKGDKTKAFDLLQQAMQLKDSVMAETNIRQINVLGAIYEAEKQDKEIARLENEKNKQATDAKYNSVLNRFFIASILIMVIVGILGYINFKRGQQLARQQQALQRQKIIELEKDKQLLTIDAMLKGQEEERSRIAKDLHDGLGSLLSGTKLSFMNVKESLELSPDNAVLFDKSLSMLDNTIGDLRKVAQNLMPEALVKFGLHEALRDFCESIQYGTGLNVTYQHFGEEKKLDKTAEVFIYRIIQELVNNVIKHAEATQVLVQLAISNNKAVITVEDNGKGFDPAILSDTKGAGMANIKYRMQYFNGTLDIITAPGKGASVNIELMI